MTPAIRPVIIDAPLLKKMLAGAPIATPPARVAFKICSILNLFLSKADVAKVPIQLPVRDRIVLVIICVFINGVVEKSPKLNEGQNIHRNTVPMKAKRFEW